MVEFRAARLGEEFVFGASRPGYQRHRVDSTSVGDWIATAQRRGIRRVVCLLGKEQLAYYDPLDLLAEYRKAFGDKNVLPKSVRDYHLCKPTPFREILLYLKDSASRQERVVVHCSGGSGRTGHVLAAWLVYHHKLTPEDALEAVAATGRNPREAVQRGNATPDELLQLLQACSRCCRSSD